MGGYKFNSIRGTYYSRTSVVEVPSTEVTNVLVVVN